MRQGFWLKTLRLVPWPYRLTNTHCLASAGSAARCCGAVGGRRRPPRVVRRTRPSFATPPPRAGQRRNLAPPAVRQARTETNPLHTQLAREEELPVRRLRGTSGNGQESTRSWSCRATFKLGPVFEAMLSAAAARGYRTTPRDWVGGARVRGAARPARGHPGHDACAAARAPISDSPAAGRGVLHMHHTLWSLFIAFAEHFGESELGSFCWARYAAAEGWSDRHANLCCARVPTSPCGNDSSCDSTPVGCGGESGSSWAQLSRAPVSSQAV